MNTAAPIINNPEALFEQGSHHLANSQMVEALPLFEQVCNLKPEFAGGHYNKGITLFRLSDIEPALDAFNKAIELLPELTPAYLNAGKCALALNMMEEAISFSDQVMQLSPESWAAYLGRGLAHYDAGDFNKAADDFRVVPKSDDSYWMAQHYLGCCLLELEKLDDAILAFHESDNIQPGRMETMEMLFLSLYKNNAFDDALALHQSMQPIDPSVKQRYSEEVRLARKATRIPLQVVSV